MKRKKPSFNEVYHGYRTFSELLEDAQKEGLLELDTDKRSGTYVVTRFGSEPESRHAPIEHRPPARRRRPSSRRRVSPLAGRSIAHGTVAAPAPETSGEANEREGVANANEPENKAE